MTENYYERVCRLEREFCVGEVAKSAGWDAYIRDRAAKLAAGDPFVHRDLLKAVEKAIAERKARTSKPQPETAHVL